MRARVLSVLAAAFLLAAGAASASAKSSCVDCHQRLAMGAVIGHDFTDWRKSAHAGAGVNCESCHGGDASAKDMAAAHKGVLRSSEPKSPIYFTEIPRTCGACHASEFKAFQRSAHFKELESSGKGPNCVTCHGSMANVILGPRDLEHTCSLCHRQPTHAFTARLELDSAGAMVRGLASALKKARDAGAVDLAPQEKAYREIVELQRAAVIQWHTFKMADVLTAEREVKGRVTEALGELKLKSPAPKAKLK
jgi:hypothetical protein